jgi:hypothetical protein
MTNKSRCAVKRSFSRWLREQRGKQAHYFGPKGNSICSKKGSSSSPKSCWVYASGPEVPARRQACRRSRRTLANPIKEQYTELFPRLPNVQRTMRCRWERRQRTGPSLDYSWFICQASERCRRLRPKSTSHRFKDRIRSDSH